MSSLKTAEEVREMQQQLKVIANEKISDYGDQLAGELMTGIILRIANQPNNFSDKNNSAKFNLSSTTGEPESKTINEIKKGGNARLIGKVIDSVIFGFKELGYGVDTTGNRDGSYYCITITW